MEEKQRMSTPPPVKDVMDVKGTAARLRYILEKLLPWKPKEWADRAEIHERTLGGYIAHKDPKDPIGKEIRSLIKTANTTLAFLVGETDNPGPDPFGKFSPVLTPAQQHLLKLLQDEFEAAVRLRENTQLEYEAAKKYRQEYERINNLQSYETAVAEQTAEGS